MAFAVIGILGASMATLDAASRVVGSQLLFRQLLWGIGGLVALWLVSRVHPNVLERTAPLLYGLGLAALVAVLVAGEVRSGTRGWFAIGPLTVQPSEFARLTTIVGAAWWIARREARVLSLREAAGAAGLVGAAAVLVGLEPDLGVALTYLPVLGVALWLGGLPRWAWVLLVVVTVAATAVAWHTALKPYQKERVLTVLDPERDPYGAGYQVRQSKIAVGSGGVVGAGIGRGSQSLLRFLPAQHTDFAFAVWAEATGFVGSSGLLAGYVLLLWRVMRAATVAASRFGVALAALVGTWLAFQVTVNLGMVLGGLPTTGVTLPLFSYGGSSLLSTCLALGLVQAVWRHRLVNQ